MKLFLYLTDELYKDLLVFSPLMPWRIIENNKSLRNHQRETREGNKKNQKDRGRGKQKNR